MDEDYFYILFGTDKLSKKSGSFIYRGDAEDVAISPIFNNSLDLFRWARTNNFEFEPYNIEKSIIYQPTRMKKVIKNLYKNQDGDFDYYLNSSVKFHPPDDKGKTFTDAEIEEAKRIYLGYPAKKQNKLKLKSYKSDKKHDSLKIQENDEFIEKIS